MINIRTGLFSAIAFTPPPACATAAVAASAQRRNPRRPLPERAKTEHGINASGWFAQVYDKRGYTAEHFQTSTTAADIALVKSMGFDHVRLSVNPQPMFNERSPDRYFTGISRLSSMLPSR